MICASWFREQSLFHKTRNFSDIKSAHVTNLIHIQSFCLVIYVHGILNMLHYHYCKKNYQLSRMKYAI